SQDGRPYALVVLAGGLSFWAFAGARELAAPRRLVAWAGASTLAVASHYFAVFLVAAEGLWLLAIHRPARRAIIAASALPAVAFFALIPVAISQRSHVYTESYLTSASLISRVEQIPAQYVVAFQPPAQVAVSIAAFLAIPVAGWLVLRRTDARERAGALVAAAVGGATVLAPIALALVGYDYLLTRAT